MKKLIESNHEELLRGTLRAYRAALDAMGNSGVQACPPAGAQLQLGLWNLQRQLADQATSQLMQDTEERVAAELQQWGERSAEYYRGKTEEFKEIMIIMAHTAEAVSQRDQRLDDVGRWGGRLHQLKGGGSGTRGQTGLPANFRQKAPEIHGSLVSPR